MTKRSGGPGTGTQTRTTTRSKSTLASQAQIMTEGQEVPGSTEVGPAAGMSAEALASLEQIQADVLARYGVTEQPRAKAVSRLRNLEDGEDT